MTSDPVADAAREPPEQAGIDALRARLAEAEEILGAFQRGEVDAVVQVGPAGLQVFTLKGADHAYREMVETMSEGAVTLSPEGLVLYCNRRFADIVGYALQQVIGAPLSQFIAAEDAEATAALLRRTEAAPARAQVWLLRQDGARVPTYLALRRLEERPVPAIVGVVTDLTELHRTEEHLRRTVRQLATIRNINQMLVKAEDEPALLADACRLLVENGGYRMAWIGIAEDTPGKPVRPAACAGAGATDYLATAAITWADEPRGRGPTGRAIREAATQVARFIDSDPAMAPWREDALRQGYASSAALPLVSGQTMLGALTVYAPRPDAFDVDERSLLEELAGDIAYAMQALRHVSERRAAEGEVRRLNAELERRVAQRTAELTVANKDLESFAYSVSHDLRAPLRAMDSFSKILLDEYSDQVGEEGRRLLGNVRRNAETLARLIDDILAFSRAGRAELKRVDVDVAAMAREVFAELLEQAGARRIELRVGELPHAPADVGALRQVWVNLLSNAIKFTAPRDPALIEISGAADAAQVEFAVRDNGVGFDPAYAHKLFGMFQRLHSADAFPGSGVGLAIVKRIVEKHGGRVWAGSTPGQGATFHFALPRTDAASATEVR